jgi:hypothetical protein
LQQQKRQGGRGDGCYADEKRREKRRGGWLVGYGGGMERSGGYEKRQKRRVEVN